MIGVHGFGGVGGLGGQPFGATTMSLSMGAGARSADTTGKRARDLASVLRMQQAKNDEALLAGATTLPYPKAATAAQRAFLALNIKMARAAKGARVTGKPGQRSSVGKVTTGGGTVTTTATSTGASTTSGAAALNASAASAAASDFWNPFQSGQQIQRADTGSDRTLGGVGTDEDEAAYPWWVYGLGAVAVGGGGYMLWKKYGKRVSS